jgi:hypothetical protein
MKNEKKTIFLKAQKKKYIYIPHHHNFSNSMGKTEEIS